MKFVPDLLPPANEVCDGYVSPSRGLSASRGGLHLGGVEQTPPLVTLGHGQQVGGVHPTGMHSC